MTHGTTLLRRTADSLYWAGRRLGRAEDLARIVLVHGDTHVDLPIGEDVGWSPLLRVAGLERDFIDAYPSFQQAKGPTVSAVSAPEAEVVEFLLCSPVNHDSVLGNLTAVREAMRTARSAMPREAWELTNSAWLARSDEGHDLARRDPRVRWLRQLLGDCQRINGALWSTMRRDTAMAVMKIGQYLERAQLTCRFLSVRAESAVADAFGMDDPYDHIRSMSLLRSLSAYQQFRQTMPARSGAGSVVEFVLRDEAFPRSVESCLAEARHHLKELPGGEDALAACADASLFVAATTLPGCTPSELRHRLDELETLIGVVHTRVASTLSSPSLDMSALDADPRRQASLAPTATPQASEGRYLVTHRTTYRYEEPAEESHNEIHLRPRTTLRQRVRSSALTVDPAPEISNDHVDAFGNHVTSFVVRGRFTELSVTATSEVDLLAGTAPPTGAPWEAVRSILERDRRLDTRVARSYRSSSRLVPATQPLADYALESFQPRRPVVEAVRDLCGRIYRDFSYEPGFTAVTTPVLEVFDARRGVCQDFAHVAIGCLRSIGLSARYVSGYIETFRPAGDQLTGADASHAWAATYLPGWGWLDLDPTNDLVGCEDHVTTAWGRDYLDVSPLRGSVVGGGRSHELEVTVEVHRLPGT